VTWQLPLAKLLFTLVISSIIGVLADKMHVVYLHYPVIVTTKMVSCCQRTLWGEGDSVAGWGIGGSVYLQTVGPKSIRLGNYVGP